MLYFLRVSVPVRPPLLSLLLARPPGSLLWRGSGPSSSLSTPCPRLPAPRLCAQRRLPQSLANSPRLFVFPSPFARAPCLPRLENNTTYTRCPPALAKGPKAKRPLLPCPIGAMMAECEAHSHAPPLLAPPSSCFSQQLWPFVRCACWQPVLRQQGPPSPLPFAVPSLVCPFPLLLLAPLLSIIPAFPSHGRRRVQTQRGRRCCFSVGTRPCCSLPRARQSFFSPVPFFSCVCVCLRVFVCLVVSSACAPRPELSIASRPRQFGRRAASLFVPSFFFIILPQRAGRAPASPSLPPDNRERFSSN